MCCTQALGAKELAQGLVNNVSLHNLNLAWNGLEDVGCTAIAQTLHQNMGLKVGTSERLATEGYRLHDRQTSNMGTIRLWPQFTATLAMLSLLCTSRSADFNH